MDIRSLLMGLAFAFAWSSAFTSARIIVSEAPPLAALSLRFLLSGVIAVSIALALGQTWRLTRAQWKATIVFGICQNALYLGLFFSAMTRIEASLASIIASTMPLLVAFASWSILGERLSRMAVVGLAVGFSGTVLIMGSRFSGGIDPIGFVYCIIGVAGLATATLVMRNASTGGNVMMIVGLQMFVGSAVLAVVSLLIGENLDVSPSESVMWAFAYTVIVPGVMATFIWFKLVDRIGATRAATFHFLNPFLGVAVAWFFLGETLGPLDIIGVIVISVGILTVQLARQPEFKT
ncbi:MULTISPECIES: DMT family transporter [Halocynthiibacter]|uniref:DMT family transporter n=1 Tax=Halocynthiibacter halioticoli TaxID=2986804 RepID=A0AAE3IZ48_9RHOB|nr:MULTISPECIES: DMT family transporter [Halocynthiibacter]MCV6823141.1 DMT family transporter [Halocynthiibacter halioticoli]MCW4056142.1 DMT family transporter [Halocynthiibacter sp. SDUM655004]